MIFTSLAACNQPEVQSDGEVVSNPDEVVGTEVTDPIDIEVPNDLEVKGSLLLAKQWNDQNGENILIISRVGPLDEAEENIVDYGDQYAELYGEQYIKTENDYELLWDIYDFQRNCPFDLSLGLLPNSTTITDLDDDGFTETTLVYKLGCRSDVSPLGMKVLMHENDTKMGLRGFMSLKEVGSGFEYDYSKVDTTGLSEIDMIYATHGAYENEIDFKEQPSVFLEHAQGLWKKYVNEGLY
ncbi:MAG: hypothetical protein AAF741_15760 [Bacteroidota bacterium]